MTAQREHLQRLLAEPWDRFVAARNALAKELRAAGERDEAAAVAAVRKPPKLVWTLDQLTSTAPDELARFAEGAEAVRSAQERGDGAALRDATKELRRVIGALGQAADVADALRVVAADADAVADLLDGVLLAVPDAGWAGPAPTTIPAAEDADGAARAAAEADEAARAAEEAERAEAAARRVDEARQRVADLEAQLADARAELAAAEADLG